MNMTMSYPLHTAPMIHLPSSSVYQTPSPRFGLATAPAVDLYVPSDGAKFSKMLPAKTPEALCQRIGDHLAAMPLKSDRQEFWKTMLSQQSPENITPLHPTDNANVSMAKEVALLTPADKVDVIRHLSGDQSAFTRYADTVLLQHKTPGLWQTMQLFNPSQSPASSSSAVSAVLGVAAMGLLVLSMAIPAITVAQPALMQTMIYKAALVLA